MSAADQAPRERTVVIALGVTQVLAWGSSYYLLAVLASPIHRDTGWPMQWIIGALSIGLVAAALCSPRVGALIDARGGRSVLALSSVLIASGLSILAISHDLAAYVAGWIVMGLGMGAGLYDAAFATLGRLYGRDARRSITNLTLFGGFASTVCWPLSAILVETFGWRGACLCYAGLQIGVCLPLHLFLLPKGAAPVVVDNALSCAPEKSASAGRATFVLVTAVITVSAVVASTLSVHLIDLVQANGVDLATAVALGALVGPAQVGARIIERALARYFHPVWTMIASVALMGAGCALLMGGEALPALALVLFGAGAGIGSIARGAVPLAVFGPRAYASVMGKIAFFALLAQALAPSVAALVIIDAGAGVLLAGLTALAALACALACALAWLALRDPG